MRKILFVVIMTAVMIFSGCHQHTWAEATCVTPKTCTECAKIESETLAEHTWVEANCGAPKTCSVCKLTEGEPVGEHNWVEATCDEPKTCTICKTTEGSKLRHSTSQSTCTEPRICVHCGMRVGEPQGHLWKEATCTSGKVCRRCNYVEGDPIDHQWKEATCTSARICKVCNLVEGNPLPHNIVNNTCTVCGYYVHPSVHPNAQYAAYFGISPNIKWVENPKTRDEIINNILWNALNGDFDVSFIGNTPYCESADVFKIIRAVSQVYPEIRGAYLNVIRGGSMGSNFRLDYDENPLPLSDKDVHNQNLAALAKAKAISQKLHENGKITDDMSQLDIVKVYYDYLDNYIGDCSRDESVEGTARDMFYDSAYACLVNRDAACGGRAAGFNLLMHVEGISAQGVSGQIIGTNSGHIISRVVADGKEYFVDWGNQKPIGGYEKTCKWFDFNHHYSTLEIARNAG